MDAQRPFSFVLRYSLFAIRPRPSLALRARFGAALAAGLILTGCSQLLSRPSSRKDAEREAPAEPPQVVQQVPATQPSDAGDEVDRTVREFVARASNARPPLPPAPTSAPTRLDWSLAADEERPATQPAPPADAAVNLEFTQQTDPDPAEVRRAEVARAEAEPLDSSGATGTPLPAGGLGASSFHPPRLGELAVRAGPRDPASPDASPAVNAPAFARSAPATIRELLDRLAPSDDDTFRDQLDRRLLAVVAGDYDLARSPLQLVSAEQSALAARLIEAWIAVRDWHLGNTRETAGTVLRRLDEIRGALDNLTELQVPMVRVCSAVRGFGQYDAIDPPRFPAGVASEFVLYCEVTGFTSKLRDDGAYLTTFDLTTRIYNRAGEMVFELKDPALVDRCKNRRRDCFIPRLIRLPATLSPGAYVAKITVADTLGDRVAENVAEFDVVARP